MPPTHPRDSASPKSKLSRQPALVACSDCLRVLARLFFGFAFRALVIETALPNGWPTSASCARSSLCTSTQRLHSRTRCEAAGIVSASSCWDPPTSVSAAGFEVVQLGGSVFPLEEYRAAFQKLGVLNGRAALKHTLALGARATETILQVGPALVRSSGVTALLIDQTSFAGGTVVDQLQLPFATVCNAVLLNPDPAPEPNCLGSAGPPLCADPDSNLRRATSARSVRTQEDFAYLVESIAKSASSPSRSSSHDRASRSEVSRSCHSAGCATVCGRASKAATR